MAQHRFFLIAVLLVHAPLAARIVEAQRMHELLTHIQDDTDLVVFDLDDTIGEVIADTGSDRWFGAKMDLLTKQQGLHYDEALSHVVPLYNTAQRKTPYRLVDEETPSVLTNLKQRNLPVMALTMRNTPLALRTIEQLSSIGVNFSATSPLKEATTLPLESDQPPYHLHGVVFCERHKKGTVLLSLFNHLGKTPRHILFVDDKHSYVQDVDKALTAAGISCTCIRFGYNDDKVKNFVLNGCADPVRESRIIETSSIAEVLAHCDNNTLVVFDLDDTLVQAPEHYGSGAWFQSMIATNQAQGMSEIEARAKAVQAWEAAQEEISLKLIESTAARVFTELKQNNIPVIGLTSRSHRIAERTLQQLAQAGLSFAGLNLWSSTTHLMDSFIFHRGVLFCEGGNKGKALKAFFKKTYHYPSRIIFVNDKKKYLETVDQMLNKFGIDFVGLHYHAASAA